MKKNIIWIVLLVVVVVIVVVVGVGYFTNPDKIEGDTVKIGFIGSLTGVDPEYGESMMNGLQLAIEEINEDGGINGKNIEVIYEDGKCIEGAKAASAAQKLINVDGIKIIIDGSCSTGLLAYSSMAEQNEVLVLTAGATSDDVSNAGDFIFRNAPASSVAGSLIAKIAHENNQNNFAIISENSDYANTMKNSALATANELGLNIVANEQFQTGTKDFRTNLLKIKSSNPDALLINPQSADLVVQIVRQSQEIGLNTQFYINYFTTPNVVTAGEFMNGVLATDLPSLEEEGGSALEFLEKYEEKFGSYPPYQFSAVLAYDLGYLLAQSIDETNSQNTMKIRDYLYQLESFNGLAASYSFDENGDVTKIPHVLKKINNGEITTLRKIN